MRDTAMTLTEHLAELRRRLLIAAAAVAAGALAGFALYDVFLLDWIRAPFDALAGRADNPFANAQVLVHWLALAPDPVPDSPINLHFFSPIEVFMVKLKVALLAGVVLASPVVFGQLWGFVAAGLHEREKSVIKAFLPVSLLLFAVGIVLAWTLMLPLILYFLIFVTGEGLVPSIMLGKYAGLVAASCLSFGVVFQLPLVLFFLTRLGLVTPAFLAKQRPYAVLTCFILSAVLTPPDVVTQSLMALPMIVLYEAGIVVSRFTAAPDEPR